MKTGKIWDLIGNTPMIRLGSLSQATGCEIYGKAEFLNPGGSVKDRPAKWMIQQGEQSGKLKPGGTIVEATAGNTGIGLAMLAAERGYKTIFSVPDNLVQEKYELLETMGAELRKTAAVPFTDDRHFYHQAKKIAEQMPGAYWTDQFENMANSDSHYATTAPEIWEQMQGKIDVFTCAAGSSGTIGGISRYLKEKNPKISVIASDPYGSGIYNYIKTGQMTIEGTTYTEGIGIGRVTENFRQARIDDVMRVSDQEMVDMVYHLAKHDGLVIGTSTGVNVVGALRLAQQHRGSGKVIVTILCDHGTRYASRLLNRKWLNEVGLSPKALKI